MIDGSRLLFFSPVKRSLAKKLVERMAQRMASSMITGRSKSVPIHGSSFHGDSLLSSSPRSCGLASNPRIRPGQGVIAMMPFTEGGAVKDHYATLGVSPGSSKHEIKKAYRRLALQYHPDVCDGEHCSLNFQQVNKAYEVNTLFHASSVVFFPFLFLRRFGIYTLVLCFICVCVCVESAKQKDFAVWRV